MPNICTNEITLRGSEADIHKIKKLVKTEDRAFSLDKIVPMPKCLGFGNVPMDEEIVANAKAWAKKNKKRLNKTAKAVFQDFPNVREPEELDSRAERFFRAISETGYLSWYPWRIKHWSTKWDTWDSKIVEEGEGEIIYTFDTAWAPPLFALVALSKQFPEVDIHIEGEVESMNSFSFDMKNGEEII